MNENGEKQLGVAGLTTEIKIKAMNKQAGILRVSKQEIDGIKKVSKSDRKVENQEK